MTNYERENEISADEITKGFGVHYEKGRWGEMKYYWFTFSDGYSVCVKGFSKQELRVEENKHGRLLRKVEA